MCSTCIHSENGQAVFSGRHLWMDLTISSFIGEEIGEKNSSRSHENDIVKKPSMYPEEKNGELELGQRP